MRGFSTSNLCYDPAFLTKTQQSQLISLPEYKSFISKLKQFNYQGALTSLNDVYSILRNLGMREDANNGPYTPELLFLKSHEATITQLVGNPSKSEWLWISLIDLNKRSNPQSIAREHFLKLSLSRLYLHHNLQLCHEYSDGEIQTILGLKKQYEMDEHYFRWLDTVT